MNKQELIAAAKRRCGGSVALQQALRSLDYSYQHVADFAGVSKRTAWQNCNGVYGCILWDQRIGKADLQEIAEQLVENIINLENGEIKMIKINSIEDAKTFVENSGTIDWVWSGTASAEGFARWIYKNKNSINPEDYSEELSEYLISCNEKPEDYSI